MFKTLRTLIVCTAIVGTGLAQAAPGQPANYGSAANNGFADREITICSGLICPDTSIGGQSTIRGDLYDKATPQFRPKLQA